MDRYVTVVATIRTSHRDRTIERTLRSSLSVVGELVGCDWAPDPDTIADAVDGAEVVEVLDLNPSRQELADRQQPVRCEAAHDDGRAHRLLPDCLHPHFV